MEVNKISSIIEPKKIEYLGDGTFYYNYDIVSNTVESNHDEGSHIEYSYVQIREYGKPEYKVLVKDIIRKYISEDEEFDIINSYNKSILLGDAVNAESYITYLNLVQTIKDKVRQDLSE